MQLWKYSQYVKVMFDGGQCSSIIEYGGGKTFNTLTRA